MCVFVTFFYIETLRQACFPSEESYKIYVGFVASENSSEFGHGLCCSCPCEPISRCAEFVGWRLGNQFVVWPDRSVGRLMGLVEIGLIVGLNNKLAGCLFLLSRGYALVIIEKICCCLADQRGTWEGNVVMCLS
jgi:hypothetical protein